ncbi:hypothetical protein N3K66_003100 [Trichothecium roseum]|uniref:Uncharacterized protein n=1 Tax=Trichothecium roseum TaxID=47278 RepID=A0ACC0V4I2_9HYPO|nr:hypothetical protein N3K66_003100 [Trichothecium roseum]
MKPTTILSASFVIASHLMGVSAAPDKTRRDTPLQKPSDTPKVGSEVSQGCFSSGGNFTNMDMDPKAVSSGSCKDVCIKKKYTAMGLHVDQCQCGDWYPPESDLVDDEKCDFQCPAYGDEACGGLKGKGYWSVFNLGISMTVQNIPEEEEDDDSSTTTSAAATSSAAAETSASEATSEPTESEDPQSDGNSSDDGPNVGAIAAGVVVGVVAVGAGIGGLFFWMRRRRNSEIEEEHRRNAAVNAFISGSKPPGSSGSISMTDSRLDPVMAHRRLSDGSIADNEDYSRKILRVTNA